MYLYFQLRTHSHLYADEDEGDQRPNLSFSYAIFLLAVVTILVSISCEYLVGSIEGLSHSWNLNQTFVVKFLSPIFILTLGKKGLILLPIVGNAAEHVSAVTFAMQNKMGLSLGIALGSSMQIALFVTPFVVLTGWAIDVPMTLYFSVFETIGKCFYYSDNIFMLC